MAGSDTISIYHGEDVTVPFQVTPVEDITGWTIQLTVEGAEHEKVIIKTPAQITNGPGGAFQFTLTAAETDLVASHYQYDVWRMGAGVAHVLSAGVFLILDVARLPVP